uniref:Nuclear receptor coactivator CREB-bp-like interlocking domain-containing protein n=1 Tax=Myotis myotis TaxID=51298 RepID=A0A7J7YF41_MYOMY|nr:hypothetical protein mMyoMyo1_011192 [Myotis myotis]
MSLAGFSSVARTQAPTTVCTGKPTNQMPAPPPPPRHTCSSGGARQIAREAQQQQHLYWVSTNNGMPLRHRDTREPDGPHGPECDPTRPKVHPPQNMSPGALQDLLQTLKSPSSPSSSTYSTSSSQSFS